MARRKAASSGESVQGSKGKQEEGDASSKKGKLLSISSKEKALLKNEGAVAIYEKQMGSREIEMGRWVDFEWLAKENSIELDTWLHIVGWNHFVGVNEVVYPRLVRILYANLDPYTMISWIGETKIKLDVETWCETFNLPNLTTEEEAPVRTLAKEALFSNLYGKEGLGHHPWMSVAELPLDPTIRLAANVLMNIIILKKGSKEQLKEEEGREGQEEEEEEEKGRAPTTPTQPTTHPSSESELATRVVKETLKLQTPHRTKKLASKPYKPKKKD